MHAGGTHYHNLRNGAVPLIPGRSMPFQHMLKALMQPDAMRRPSATKVLTSALFKKQSEAAKCEVGSSGGSSTRGGLNLQPSQC